MKNRPALFAILLGLSLGSPALADPDPGAYLAARQAGLTQEFDTAARFFEQALRRDPGNLQLIESAFVSHMATGAFDQALPLAESYLAQAESQMASIVLMADAAASEDWDAIFDYLEAGHEVGPMIDGLVQAWAFVGKGQMRQALGQFDDIAASRGLRSVGLMHKAFALSLAGDLEGADAILSQAPEQGVAPTRASVLAHIEILARLGEFERAGEVLEQAFSSGPDPVLDDLRASLQAETVPARLVVGSAREGIAFAFLSLAEALQGEANDTFLLIHAQAAAHIDPDRAAAQITAAQLLHALGQHDLAAERYARVATDDPEYHVAERGRADTLRAAGRMDAAIEAMTGLARSHGDLAIVHATLGDLHRQAEEYERARIAYDTALELFSEDDPALWLVTYMRGIAHERLGNWPEAEADFRAALELNPGQPSVLNYLGYSLVERSENLDEALGMIEDAAAARPDSGAITDSLGWVLYKLGRYDEAVSAMERAVELEPVDPIITDHLGDVYWMVGRTREAQFQWQRALSFSPEPDLADRIRRKLDMGLDAVLAEEGADPADADYDRQ